MSLYRQNLAKALELLSGEEDASEAANDIVETIGSRCGKLPAITDDPEYFDHETALLQEYLEDRKLAEKAQKFAREKALKETERTTYQAMEAFVHNLNTMHSRAGAQIPFSSINYGMDILPKAGFSYAAYCLPPRRVLETGDPHFPDPYFQGEGRYQL